MYNVVHNKIGGWVSLQIAKENWVLRNAKVGKFWTAIMVMDSSTVTNNKQNFHYTKN